ncbi:hormogonium tapered terminus morphoprotein TftA [Trichothermofontia sp.]
MGRIFLSAGRGGFEGLERDVGIQVAGTTEAQEMILLRDWIVAELTTRQAEVLAVPDELSAAQTIAWINERIQPGDVALEIHADTLDPTAVRGATVFYISQNQSRKTQAEQLIFALLRRVPQLPNRGAKPDSATNLGQLPFCRDIIQPSLLLQVACLSHADDRALLQSARRVIAAGIADGLVAWRRSLLTQEPMLSPATIPQTHLTFPPCKILINQQPYGEQGIDVYGNAYVPIDLADCLGIDLPTTPPVRRIRYRGIVYIKAIDLRDFGIWLQWDSADRTLAIRSLARLHLDELAPIMGRGQTSEVQLTMFLKANHESALAAVPDLAKLYREEALIEGVNHDIAFSQMCLETNFLRCSAGLPADAYNFGGLGSGGGASETLRFASARLGVRAHLQHLKAYACAEPLVQEQVDPRFRFITRGVAPTIAALSGRWSADPQYGAKVLGILRRLYESAGLL